MTRTASVAFLGLVLPALACTVQSSTRLELQRRLRIERIERGLAAHKKLIPWLHALPDRWKTGYSRAEKQLFLDAAADCVTTQRVGTNGDGGKWLCNPYRIQPPCVVYGFGAGPEISFERAMAEEFSCEVHTFDPSQESIRNYATLEQGQQLGKGKLTYHRWALGPVSDDPAQAMQLVMDGRHSEVKTLADIAKLLGHTKVDVLKIDIEGGELSALPQELQQGTLRELQVKELMVEFHSLDPQKFDRFVSIVDSLENAGYLLFRKEINPYAAETTAEYAFADREYLLD